MDKKLLQNLYNKYYKELYIYAYSLSMNKTVAEDLVQETFLKALLSNPKEKENLRPWLYKIVKNLYINLRNKEKVFKQEPQFQDFEGDGLDFILKKEKDKLIFQAILNLKETSRKIIVMQFFGSISQREIARQLNLTEGNVRIIVHRAKKEIKEFLEVKGYEF